MSSGAARAAVAAASASSAPPSGPCPATCRFAKCSCALASARPKGLSIANPGGATGMFPSLACSSLLKNVKKRRPSCAWHLKYTRHIYRAAKQGNGHPAHRKLVPSTACSFSFIPHLHLSVHAHLIIHDARIHDLQVPRPPHPSMLHHHCQVDAMRAHARRGHKRKHRRAALAFLAPLSNRVPCMVPVMEAAAEASRVQCFLPGSSIWVAVLSVHVNACTGALACKRQLDVCTCALPSLAPFSDNGIAEKFWHLRATGLLTAAEGGTAAMSPCMSVAMHTVNCTQAYHMIPASCDWTSLAKRVGVDGGSWGGAPMHEVPKVTGLKDTGLKVTGPKVTGLMDTGLKDTGLKDIGLKDTGLKDTGLKDTGLKDTGLKDTGLKDTGLKDTGLKDTGLKDTGLKDTGLKVTGLKDTGLKDTGLKDIGLKDTGLKDTGLKDTGLKDTEVAECRSARPPVRMPGC
eukprot:1160456-Pelagomonas_calceolata.AAC.15